MNIVFTGKLEETRNELKAMVEGKNCTMQKTVNWDTDILFVGVRGAQFGDTKSQKELLAEKFGVRIKRINSIHEVPQYLI